MLWVPHSTVGAGVMVLEGFVVVGVNDEEFDEEQDDKTTDKVYHFTRVLCVHSPSRLLQDAAEPARLRAQFEELGVQIPGMTPASFIGPFRVTR